MGGGQTPRRGLIDHQLDPPVLAVQDVTAMRRTWRRAGTPRGELSDRLPPPEQLGRLAP
jgi:hypothetical protein